MRKIGDYIRVYQAMLGLTLLRGINAQFLQPLNSRDLVEGLYFPLHDLYCCGLIILARQQSCRVRELVKSEKYLQQIRVLDLDALPNDRLKVEAIRYAEEFRLYLKEKCPNHYEIFSKEMGWI